MTDSKHATEGVCMWSGVPFGSGEHQVALETIFPKSIGGTETLPVGSVSWEWQQRLKSLDVVLSTGHPAMMMALRKDQAAALEKESQPESGGDGITWVDRGIAASGSLIIDSDFDAYRESFSRALHKCVANLICARNGPHYVRKNCLELLYFIKEGGDPVAWSYAVSLANPFSPLCIAPQCLKVAVERDQRSGKESVFVSFIHTSGIWLAASQPHALTQKVIEAFSNTIPKEDPIIQRIIASGGDMRSLFGMVWDRDREYIGDLNFVWIKCQMDGTLNPDDAFHLLTRCRRCGQINPTGVMIPKERVLTAKSEVVSRQPKNTWNYYAIDDLPKAGFDTEALEAEDLLTMIQNTGIAIPAGQNPWRLPDGPLQCRCINCGSTVVFEAKDCFL